MAPTNARGRPKKTDSPITGADAAVASAGTAKRGRGRPPKDPSGLPQRVLNPKITKEPGRRGRPPKDPNAPRKTPVKPAAKKAATPGSGRRGRPSKAAQVAARITKGGSGKGRGRPPKAVAAAVEEEELDIAGEEEELGENDLDMSDADADADADADDDDGEEDRGE